MCEESRRSDLIFERQDCALFGRSLDTISISHTGFNRSFLSILFLNSISFFTVKRLLEPLYNLRN